MVDIQNNYLSSVDYFVGAAIISDADSPTVSTARFLASVRSRIFA